jgi:hypothetical protein
MRFRLARASRLRSPTSLKQVGFLYVIRQVVAVRHAFVRRIVAVRQSVMRQVVASDARALILFSVLCARVPPDTLISDAACKNSGAAWPRSSAMQPDVVNVPGRLARFF